MNPKITSLILLLISINLLSLNSYALASDGTKLLHINSQQLFINVPDKQAIYQGNVHAKQGTRQLWGNRLVIKQNQQNQLHSVITYGEPAKTQSITKIDGPLTTGQADTIYYLPQQDLIRYQGNAIVKQAGNIFKGAYFDYNTRTKLITGPSTHAEESTIILPPYDQNKLLKHDSTTTPSTS